ncbi:hypothetical protein PV396_24430 [Streptomyces sp. ME02-8801-2C]|uniref:hypothetical protein n=1 Tax=Streptomyces sp. ME02-8801-2C TaxID=3028680 RepID=UPI0029AB0EB6|nr:hypothetical protein [Streptomyces sp. ME02-8801-2C]MDX3455049.1 hypothetical protein [Streptomyces sp. ME02-8801-2C]
MHATRRSWLSAAHSAGWFQLSRHDDPDPAAPPADPAADPAPAPAADPAADPADPDPADPEGADQLGDAGKKALDTMKAERAAAKRAAAAEKKRADDLAAKVAEFEDRDKSELEKATAKAERFEATAAKAQARAVQAEVKVLASGFADADDAVVHLQAKMAGYATADGEVDTETIKADLAEILERKPHLRKQTAPADPAPEPGKQTPKPDHGQGPRPNTPPANYREADRSTVKAAAAQYGVRLR